MGRGRGRPRKSRAPKHEEVEEVDEDLEEIKPDEPEIGEEEEPVQEEDGDEDGENGEEEEEEEEDPQERIWETFKEEHYETVEQLPLYLHRTYRLIRDLDVQSQAHQREIQRLLRVYYEGRRKTEVIPEVKHPDVMQSTEGEVPEQTTKQDFTSFEQPSNASFQDVEMVDAQISEQSTLPVTNNDGAPDVPSSEQMEGISPPAEARASLTRLAVLIDEWVQNCEEKVNLTKAAYDSTDRHVRILDAAIAEQRRIPEEPSEDEEEMDEDEEDEEDDNITVENEVTTRRDSRRRNTRQQSRPFGHTQKDSKKRRKPAPVTSQDTDSGRTRSGPPSRSKPPIDMDVFPDEPKYCYCIQVSFGAMVLCDNKHCAREWFHLGCVGLKDAPAGKWYCDDCSQALGRKTRRKR